MILLKEIQGLKLEEIAEMLTLPLGTVKNRIFRAREMLREALGDLLAGSPHAAAGPVGRPRRSGQVPHEESSVPDEARAV